MENDLEDTAAQIDSAVRDFDRGVLVPFEVVEVVLSRVLNFLREAVATAEEIELVLSYGRLAIEQVAEARGVMDPVLVEYFDQALSGHAMAGVLAAHLELYLEPVELAARRGDPWGWDRVAELCRSGWRTQHWLLHLSSAAETILRLAHDLGHVEALRDAVSPRYSGCGQIGHPGRSKDDFRLALNLLAHLAADPDRGGPARSALLDLADYVETAGEAVVRLPMHLLDDDNRGRLLEVHEARVDLFASNPFYIPLDLHLLRDNRVVRSALWQAFDARHIT